MNNALENYHFYGPKFITNKNAGNVLGDVTCLVASLLVYAAKGDGSISQPETDKMIETLCTRLGLGNAEAMDHLSTAVMHLADKGNFTLDLQQLTTDLSQDERESMLSMILEIVMVDGELDPGEYQVVVHTGQILRLSQDKVHSELRSITNVSQ
ncbi:MAG: TerB family tellurite resistance protein [Halioglobus sp.]